MDLPEITTREAWLAARTALLAKEKAATRARDELNAERRRLPMVEITEDYAFTGPDGPASLLDLLEGRRQLIVSHFMFAPDWDEGCPSCSAGADEVSDGLLRHLHARGTTLAYVSRAPIDKIERYKAARGWRFPWYSSFGSSFNVDFGVTMDSSVTPPVYNYKAQAQHEADGTGYYFGEEPTEEPGTSCFLRVEDRVFHTYSTYGRGDESLGGAYNYLDLTALGRQEEWEEPKGRVEVAHAASPDFS